MLHISFEGNEKLRQIVEEISNNEELAQYWDSSNVNAIGRLCMNDHGRVHAEIVAENAIKLLRILKRKGFEPNIVKDYGLSYEDAEIVVLLASLLHDIGHVVHRAEHPIFSAILSSQILEQILRKYYAEKEFVIMKSEILHAIVAHDNGKFKPLTLEAACVRLADSLDAKEGRARIPYEKGRISIHSFSALAIKDIIIKEGSEKPISVEIIMENPAGIFQLDELIVPKLKSSPLAEHVELTIRILGEEHIVRKIEI